jgi:NTE family protein
VTQAARPRLALVLAGGAARGAYEVGVVDYILGDVARALGRSPPLDILCGTSVGAINACALAAGAHEPAGRAARMVRQWTQLRVGHVLRFDPGEVFSMLRGLVGRGASTRKGGILDPTGLQRIVAAGIEFRRIPENIRAGRVSAVTVSTTQIATGRTTVYVDRADPGLPEWGRDPTIVGRRAHLSAPHALASAAIPFLFPPVLLEGEYHCDGGLRQNVPLSPARKLGASAMIVVSPRYEPAGPTPPALAAEREDEFPSPLFLLGKTLNALMLDRIENDIDRLQRITGLLDAGTKICGPDFVDRINRELRGGLPERALRPIHALLIRSSENIAERAADFVRSPAFATRASGVIAVLFRRLGEGRESDVLSYLLFDGEFARQLIDVGRADARAHHDELCEIFEGILSVDQATRAIP